MLRDRWAFINGDFVPWESATIHLMSHSLSRGSAIFEVLSFHETPRGPAVFRLDRHVERLFRTASMLYMTIPLTEHATQQAILTTVKRNRLTSGVIKVICYFHQVSFDILAPQQPLDFCVVAVDPINDFDRHNASRASGITACVCRWRKLHPDTVPVEAKVAANYLSGMVANLEAKKRGFDLGIMLDTEGYIAEGGTESVFLVKDGVLMTPSLGNVLHGITRRSILEIAQHTGMEVREDRLRAEAFINADEVFVASTNRKISPVTRIDGHPLPTAPGPITSRLQQILQSICSGADQRFQDWLFPVE